MCNGSVAILLLAHGSKNKAAVAEMEAITKHYAQAHPSRCVFHAFEEFAEPSLESWAYAHAEAYREIVVVPLYLMLGTHLIVNLPKKLAWLQENFPNTTFTVASHIGADRRLSDIIEERVNSVLPVM